VSAKPLHIYPLLFVLSGCGVISVTAGSIDPTSLMAAFLNQAVTATPIQSLPWANAIIAKPTYTPIPNPSETPTTSLPSITPTVQTLSVEIVPDTPVPEPAGEPPAEMAGDYTQAENEPMPVGNGGAKYILVDISDQQLYAYEGDMTLYSFVASTGMKNSTATGNFSVLSKIPNAYGATWNIWMANWLGIYWAGGLQNGIHALPILPNGAQLWSGFLGTPISYGCVVLGAYESGLLYDWAEIGTPVDIQW